MGDVPAVLGPAPCHACRTPLVWTPRGWLERDGAAHRCARVLCMTDAEWAAWDAANRMLTGRRKAGRPCLDCPLPFAETMRAVYRCNGTPGRSSGFMGNAQERRRTQWRESKRRKRLPGEVAA